jgi:hypothetical protein
VGIRADDDIAGAHVAVLREDLVTDSAHVAADVVELVDAVGGDELADLFWLVAVWALRTR